MVSGPSMTAAWYILSWGNKLRVFGAAALKSNGRGILSKRKAPAIVSFCWEKEIALKPLRHQLYRIYRMRFHRDFHILTEHAKFFLADGNLSPVHIIIGIRAASVQPVNYNVHTFESRGQTDSSTVGRMLVYDCEGGSGTVRPGGGEQIQGFHVSFLPVLPVTCMQGTESGVHRSTTVSPR